MTPENTTTPNPMPEDAVPAGHPAPDHLENGRDRRAVPPSSEGASPASAASTTGSPRAGKPLSADKPRPAGKSRSAAERRRRRLAAHRWIRFGVQIVFFALAPAVFAGAFNGVKYLAGQIGAGAPLEFTSFLALLVACLAFTVLFGRFFCGYACAFGTLGDVLYSAFEFLRAKTRLPRARFPEPLVKALSLLKYVILVVICAACFTGTWQAVSGYSPWVAFAGFTSGSLDGIEPLAFVLLGLVVLGMIVRERFFCQFLCPMGAVFSLMPVLGFSEFTRRKDRCARSCGRCHDGCPVGIWPDEDELGHGECISCGRCAATCPLENVNLVALDRPLPKPVRLKGSGALAVLAKALALLALLWLVNATRLPF